MFKNSPFLGNTGARRSIDVNGYSDFQPTNGHGEILFATVQPLS
jgi:hypothetical protein